MQTKVLTPSAQNIALAAQLLAHDEVVGIPTETVYGLAANACSDTAVKKIFAAKGRPQDNPLISHIADMDMLCMVNKNIPAACYQLAAAFWPGPLTMIMQRADTLADSVCAGLDTAAVRMPSHAVARSIIAAAGVPLAAPSANISGSPSPTDAATTFADMDGKVPLIIDGGSCTVGVESTVVSLAGEVPVLLRPGYITLEQLEQALGCEVKVSPAVLHQLQQGQKAQSPGMKYKHYAPKAEVTILQGGLKAFAAYVAAHKTEGTYCLCFDGEESALPVPCITYGEQNSPAQQAQQLFSALRALDENGAKTVFARAPQQTGVAMAVYNRLLRAAAFRVVEV